MLKWFKDLFRPVSADLKPEDAEKCDGCRCFHIMGMDYYFLPVGTCLYGKCSGPLPPVTILEEPDDQER